MDQPAMPLLSDDHRARLRQARLDQGLTQIELARKLGCTQTMACYLERGRKQPSVHMLDAWCRTLGLELSIEIRARQENLPA